MTNAICHTVANKEQWDAWLASDLPSDVVEHAKSCSACNDTVSELQQIRAGLKTFRESTAARAANIRLTAEIMERIDEPTRNRSFTRWRGWLAVPALALALLAFFLLRQSHHEIQVDAQNGAIALLGDERREIRGESIKLPMPLTLSTAEDQRAWLRLESSTLALWPDSALVARAPKDYALERGGMRIESASEIPVNVGNKSFVVRGAGNFTIEMRDQSEKTMKTLKKHHVMGGAAIIAIAVYGGWATLSNGDSETRVDGPGGLYLDEDGNARRFGLKPVDSSGDDSLALAPKGAGPGSAEGADGQSRSGAFWNSEQQVMQFRIQGEAIDADSGEPIPDFQIIAAPTESKAYAQTKPISWKFSEQPDGKFELDGLGLGTWRITGRASGYAPVVQTLELSRVNADPYLVIPLSLGAQITGKVIDPHNQPVSSARVGLVECLAAQSPGPHCTITKTAADGSFSLPRLPEEQVFALRAAHERFGVATVRGLKQEPASSEHIVIQLSGTARIYGEVSSGKEKHPVAGATVASDEFRATSDQNGFYEMLIPLKERPEAFVEDYPNGPRTRAKVTSYPDNRSAREITWVNAATHVAEVRIDFRLEMEDARLFGQVLDSQGRPMPNLELQVANTTGWAKERGHETFPTSATTDQNGRYSIEHIPAQAGYMIRYRAPGQEAWEMLGYVNVMKEEPVEANFRVGSGTIRGRFVSHADGQPLTLSVQGCGSLGAKLLGAGAEYFYLPHCYPDGRFEFTGLAAGSYKLHGRAEWMGSPVKFLEERLSIAPGQIIEDKQVRVEGEGSDRWRFRILDSEGRFVSGAFVRYHAEHTSFTSNLNIGPDGTALQTINRRFKEIFIDCPGYVSQKISLEEHTPSTVIEVHLEKVEPQE
jgi:hypothetical protein